MINIGTYISPLDIKTIILDLFLGHPSILAFGVVILISFLSAKFNMSNRNFMLILMVSSIIMAGFMGEAIYIIILVVLGFVIFKNLSRLFQ